jgi:hypothetical protein
MSRQFQATAALPQAKEPSVPIEQQVEWTPGPVCTVEMSEISCLLLGIEPRFLGPPARSLVTISAKLSRFTWDNLQSTVTLPLSLFFVLNVAAITV